MNRQDKTPGFSYLIGGVLVFLLAAAAALFMAPLFDCDLCLSARKIPQVKPVEKIVCPCCGKSMKLNLMHKWFLGHGKHLHDHEFHNILKFEE